MGDTSPAPQPSTIQSPSPPTPAPAPAPSSETTPLLPAPPTAPISSPTDQLPEAPQRSLRKKRIVILTFFSFILSIAALALIAATYIALAHAPRGFYLRSSIQQAIENIAPIIVTSAALSLANLIRLRTSNRPLPFILNLFFDILIAAYNLILPAEALSAIADYFPTPCNNSYIGHDKAICERAVAQLRVLIQVAMVVALGVGFVHLILLILRCIETWHSRFWRSENGSSTGTGELTFVFSIRLMRDRNDRNDRNTNRDDRNGEA